MKVTTKRIGNTDSWNVDYGILLIGQVSAQDIGDTWTATDRQGNGVQRRDGATRGSFLFPTKAAAVRALVDQHTEVYGDDSSVESQRPVYVVKDVHGCFAIEPEHHGLTVVVWSTHVEDALTFNERQDAEDHASQLKQLGFKNVAGISQV